MHDPLDRIAAALERLTPPPPGEADLAVHPAYLWRGQVVEAAQRFRPLPLARLVGIERQRDLLVANLQRLAGGLPAQDVLLWGARGQGKSALVAAAVGHVQQGESRLALVQAAAPALASLPALFDRLAGSERAFALFIDDLGFDGIGDARTLRSLLEGGAEARPDNVRLLVTSNRRHLLPRAHGEEESAINPRDAADDALALADRFGLSLGFHALDQDGYVAVVRAYAEAHGLSLDEQDAINWATRRGARSGRIAWHYVVELAGREGKRLD